MKRWLSLFLLFTILVGVLPVTAATIKEEAGSGGGDEPDTTTKSVSGFAWSSTIGWISFSSAGADSSITYGVYLLAPDSSDPNYRYFGGADGDVGYAWNQNIGWIKFDPQNDITSNLDPNDPFPIPSSQPRNAFGAKMQTSTGRIFGWARACIVFQSGCSGALKGNSERGGWDGWISFSEAGGSSINYQTRVDSGNNPTSFAPSGSPAWGGSVVGWISLCDPNGSFDYCGRIGGLSASCEVLGEPGDVPKDANGIITVGDGGQVKWHGRLNGGTPSYSHEWIGSASGVSLYEEENSYFDVYSTYQCPSSSTVTPQASNFISYDSSGEYASCRAQATVKCDPNVVPPPNSGATDGNLTTPTPNVITIVNKPLTSPAISSETTFKNQFSQGSEVMPVYIISTKSLVPGSTVSLSDSAFQGYVKCRFEKTVVTDQNDPLFGGCGSSRHLDLAPNNAETAHFNIRVSGLAPLSLNQNSPYRIVVGSSTCAYPPAPGSACADVVKSFIFDYGVGTIRPL